MNIIKPESLKLGDTISIIAPSGPVEEAKIITAKKYFEKKGYKVKIGKNIFNHNKYLAGTDEERLEDLHEAFSDIKVKVILCARGGYGAIRLLDKIDYNIIKNNPKIFCGYSDITALSIMFLKETNLITYSSPMAQGDFGVEPVNKKTENSFFKVLSGEKEEYIPSQEIIKGSTEGVLWGGNLSTIVSLCGANIGQDISIFPNEKFIFVTEDVSEPVYKIDKMLHQLLNIKQFRDNIAGIAFGEFTDTDNENWLKDLYLELAGELHIPIYSGYKFSHNQEKQTLPVGTSGYMNNGIITY